jgi:ELWxxDGT repeat protein
MDINPGGASYPTELTPVGDVVFFAADDGVHGVELWKSDGTAAGTAMVRDIKAGSNASFPSNLVDVNGTLFFTAVDGVHGRELWKSDGSAAGTVMVKDIETGGKHQFCGGGIYLPYPAVAVGSRLFFVLHCGGFWSPVLYVSDGTAAGTNWLDTPTIVDLQAWDGTGHFADTLGGLLYFAVGGGEENEPWGIWVTDGTNAGTHAMAGSPTDGPISFLPAHGTKLYFVTSTYPDPYDDQPVPDRLWRTDGTAAGTFPLTAAGDLTSGPTEAVLLNDRVYFNGDGLWKTDGSVGGTKKISNGEVSGLTAAGGTLYVERDDHLWRSDGTAAGTTDLGQFGIYGPSNLIAVGDELCFAAIGNDGAWALWESDGTSPGTHQVSTFAGTPEGLQQAAVGNTLFFAADDAVHGTELWSYTP